MKQENKIVGLYPLTKFYLAIVLHDVLQRKQKPSN